MGAAIMAEGSTHNMSCKEEGHDEHLCFLMYDGFHLRNKEAYKELVQNACFRCQNCGRTAKNDINLCAPIRL